MVALEAAGRELGVRLSKIAAETGVEPASLSRMKNGARVVNGPSLVALAAWSGLDLMDYVIDTDDADKMPRHFERFPEPTYQGALERVRQLEDELERIKSAA